MYAHTVHMYVQYIHIYIRTYVRMYCTYVHTYVQSTSISTWVGEYSWLVVLIALSLPHAIPLKAPWIVSTSDSEYLFCLPVRVLTIQVLLYVHTYVRTSVLEYVRTVHTCTHVCLLSLGFGGNKDAQHL